MKETVAVVWAANGSRPLEVGHSRMSHLEDQVRGTDGENGCSLEEQAEHRCHEAAQGPYDGHDGIPFDLQL